ncbi:MAG TPA: hypothetical protein VGQ91_16505 [Ideonella sp.]|jgi:probable HAF family extracellular repeat protein|nr:hypothetical protein [Ideonella sp.]
MKTSIACLGAVALLALAVSPARAGLKRYTCTALASVGDGQQAAPNAINKYGRIAGTASFPDGGSWAWGAVYWKDDRHASALGDLLPPDYANTQAFGINDDNLIVGIAQIGCGDFCWHNRPVAWHGTAATVLPLPEGSVDGWAFGVNRHGRIVGRYTVPGTTTEHAAMWHGGRVHDLGTLGSRKNRWWQNSAAYAVNDAGAAVGYSVDDTGDSQAARWDADGQVAELTGLPGGTQAAARSINKSGLIVGWSNTPSGGSSSIHAVAWLGNRVVDIDPHAHEDHVSTAIQVNNRGTIVGYRIAGATVVPLVWPQWSHKAMRLKDFVDGSCQVEGEAFELTYVHGINDDDVIIASGQAAGGREAAFRLSPH